MEEPERCRLVLSPAALSGSVDLEQLFSRQLMEEGDRGLVISHSAIESTLHSGLNMTGLGVGSSELYENESTPTPRTNYTSVFFTVGEPCTSVCSVPITSEWGWPIP